MTSKDEERIKQLEVRQEKLRLEKANLVKKVQLQKTKHNRSRIYLAGETALSISTKNKDFKQQLWNALDKALVKPTHRKLFDLNDKEIAKSVNTTKSSIF